MRFKRFTALNGVTTSSGFGYIPFQCNICKLIMMADEKKNHQRHKIGGKDE